MFCVFEYGYLFLMGNNIFVIKVEKLEKQILLEDTYYIYSDNDVKIEQINKLEKMPLFLFHIQSVILQLLIS